VERWQQVEEIFHEALQRRPAERDAYLRQACRDDSGLRREVSSLLANHSAGQRSESWIANAAAALVTPPSSLQPGQSLGPYRIESFLAAGGMGEVYRATDTRLNREVAIKVSAAQFSDRFEREARLIASLNHSNICQLYDVGPNYLVMELVEGPTLADRIRQGPLQIGEVLSIACQMAEGLEAAHEKGRIHRDLKPGNIKITPQGVLKLLDFGLAKAIEEPAGGNPIDSPTMTMSATHAGMILGTASYMSPEQAAGKPVDKRSDIWSFGAVLWEMLTGKRLFEGETVSHTLADVLRAEIDFDKLPATTPATLRDLLRRCLDRDVRNRLRDIGEARVAIQNYLANPVRTPEVNVLRTSSRRLTVTAFAAAIVLLGALGILAFIHFRERPSASDVVRFQFTIPDKVTYGQNLAVSPDGKRVVFAAVSTDGVTRLWIHSFESLDSWPLTGTEGATLRGYSLWSWDSRFVAFQTGRYGAGGKLTRIEVSGGPPQNICDLPDTLQGGFWSRKGQIVFGTAGTGLYQVPASGGAPSPVTTLDPAHQERSHAFPVLLPDERHFIYGISAPSTKAEDSGVYLGSLDGASPASRGRKLLPDQRQALYVPSLAAGAPKDEGYLLFVRGSVLMAQTFDARRAELNGEPTPIVPGIADAGGFGVSANGVLVYRAGGHEGRELTWFDRGGKVLGAAAPPAAYNFLALAPDDKRVAVQRLEAWGAGDIWILDLARGGLGTRFTFDPADDAAPVWSPDGKRIIWTSTRDGPADLYQRSTTGGKEEPLLQSSLGKIPYDWSSDGRYLLYGMRDPKSKRDLWVLPMTGERQPLVLANTEFDEAQGQFSPDTRWVAYQSDESGTTEIHVRPFVPGSGGGANVMVSSGGGYQPRWRRNDGKELYYLTGDGKLVAVDVSGGATLKLGQPHVLFTPPIWAGGVTAEVHRWDVSSDGQKFLIPTLPAQAKTAFSVVMNWQAALKK
jgi:serine/threonine protein kinase/Tol biopolymer transport system component